MRRQIYRWLLVFESICVVAGMRGLSWAGRLVWPLVAREILMGIRSPRLIDLLAVPIALPAQVALASVRRWNLNPLERLRPGTYPDRRITRIDINGENGSVPSLLIEPYTAPKTVVLVAHGSGCDKTFYIWRLADVLIARGYGLLLIDLDGHGASPRLQCFPQIVESVAGPARWLRERYTHVVLLGMSLGGAVTARAVADGADCDGLVLWETPVRLRLDRSAYRAVQLREALGILRPSLLHLFRDGSLVWVMLAWRTSGIRAEISTWDLFDALDARGSLKRMAARTDRPALLMVYAGRDNLIGPEQFTAMQETTTGWAEIVLVPGASHVSLPIEPETIKKTVAWIAAHGSGNSAE
jgi:pimeloyl-ACP methyl ester carboxylesterase